MTVRERHLKERVTHLQLECARLEREMNERRKKNGRPLRWCHYCGAPTYGVACFAHSDLLLCDPGAPKA